MMQKWIWSLGVGFGVLAASGSIQAQVPVASPTDGSVPLFRLQDAQPPSTPMTPGTPMGPTTGAPPEKLAKPAEQPATSDKPEEKKDDEKKDDEKKDDKKEEKKD